MVLSSMMNNRLVTNQYFTHASKFAHCVNFESNVHDGSSYVNSLASNIEAHTCPVGMNFAYRRQVFYR